MTIESLMELRRFVSTAQLEVLHDFSMGEERAHFIHKMDELTRIIGTMPRTYGQDGLGDNAVVYLHYFNAGGDWYITERDCEPVQYQAFGLADPFGDGGELGYISIVELIRAGAEVDLYWTPATLAAIRAKRQGVAP